MKYKAIFFDWDKTLSTSRFWEQLRDAAHPRHSWHESIQDLVFKNKSLVSDWMIGKKKEDDIIHYIHAHLKYSKKLLKQDLAESCRQMRIVDIKVLDLISRLRKEKGIKCYIATDNMDVFSKYTVPALRLRSYFDDILNSSELKTLKYPFSKKNRIPFFHTFLKENNLKYTDVLLLDDSREMVKPYGGYNFKVKTITSSNDIIKILNHLIHCS